MDPLDFAGRAVVVTGGTRGIGAAIASAFRSAGADVLVCARTSPLSDPPGDFFPADVRDPAQAAALVAEAVARFGRLDVLVNNAGGSPEVPAGTASPRLHAKIIELNLIAPLHVSQAANAVMRTQPTGGVILMIGSVSGTRPSPGTAAYGAAKAGLHHLTTSLAAEWAPLVRVNNLVVGPVAASAVAAPGFPAPSGAPGFPAPSGAPGFPAPSGAPGFSAPSGASGFSAPSGAPGLSPSGGGAAADAGVPGAPDSAADRVVSEVPVPGAASTVGRTVPMGRAATAAEVAGACLLLASPLAGYISGASLAVHGGGEWPAYLADLRDTAYRAEK